MLSAWSIVAIVVASFILTQLLVSWLQRRRLERIEQKSLRLCSEDASGTPIYADGAGARLPITLVTGFLGSGKTTLVNRILTSSDHGLRIIVVENELGAISIDHALIDGERQASMPEGVVVLKNGCMCCSGETPGSELERVLDKLLEMSRLEGGTLPFDAVLIETTGMADPSPILQVLNRREMTESRFYLDAVIALVDCKHVLQHLQPAGPFGFARRRAEAEKQLAFADRVILNKADLVDAATMAAVERAVRAVNSTASLIEATHACVEVGSLLGLHAFDSARWLACRETLGAPTDTAHAAAVTCISLETTLPISLPKLQSWLQAVVAQHDADIYRMKGLLAIDGHNERFVLHGIHAQISGHFERPWGTGEPRHSALVVIAHRMDRHELERGFHACASGDEARLHCLSQTLCGEADDEHSDDQPKRPHQKDE